MKRMKRRISLLLAVLLAIQLTAAVPALAADPKITVTFLDAEGNPIGAGTYSYEGTEFDISKLDTYLTSLSSAELEALGKAAEVKLETSYTAPEGPEITAEDNAEGKPLTVKVNGSASKIKVAEGANVTFVGDFDAGNMTDAAVHTVGDATVSVEGDIEGHDHLLPENGILVENEVNSSGEDIPNKADITFVGDVQGNPTGIQAEGNAHIDVDGSVFGVRNGIIADDNAVIETEGGEVRSLFTGIQAKDDSSVTTEGNVIARGSGEKIVDGSPVLDEYGNPVVEYHGNAVEARDNAEVKITGDAEGNNIGVMATDSSTVEVNGSVTGSHTEFSETTGPDGTTVKNSIQIGTGVAASGDATVTVTGNVSGGNVGIGAADEATVEVGGNVRGGNVGVYVTDDATVEIGGTVFSPTGNGIISNDKVDSLGEKVPNTADVHVTGDVGTYNDGIIVKGNTTVTVDGDINAGHVIKAIGTNAEGEEETKEYYVGNGINASGNASVTAHSVEAAGDAIKVEESADIHVKGDVISTGNMGICTKDNSSYDPATETYDPGYTDATVTVDGNLTSRLTSVVATGESVISIGGNVVSQESQGITANQESQVTVSGNVDSAIAGIIVNDGADVTVDGSVHSESGTALSVNSGKVYSTEIGDWIDPESPASAVIGGDVTAENGTAIQMNNDATVTVLGNVTGGKVDKEEESSTSGWEETPIGQAYQAAVDEAFSDFEEADFKEGAVQITNSGDGSGKLVINGTVSANGDTVPMVINLTTAETEGELPEMKLPEMKIYEIQPGTDGTYFDVNVEMFRWVDFSYTDPETGTTETVEHAPGFEYVELPEEEHAALVETIAAAIQYIIKVDPAYQNGAIKVADEFYDAENDLYAAHEGEEVSVTFSLDSSYALSASGNYTLKDNGDGTWTLTVQRGGGVTLTAVIRRQEQQAEPVSAERVHPAVGKSILFGRYDLDGDEKPEELSWQILRVSGGYARLAMIAGFDEMPGDFDSAFNEWETEQIREGSLQPLDAGRTKELFGDGMVHPSMYVRFDALKLD